MDIAFANCLELEHVCGGVTACSTCHVKIKKGRESCNEPSEVELDQLDEPAEGYLEFRLGC